MSTTLRADWQRQAEWIVVGEADSGRDALKTFREYRPNVTLRDYSMLGMKGLEAARPLRERDTSAIILMVTADPMIRLQRKARKSGLNGFCPKDKLPCLQSKLWPSQTHFHLREPAQATA